jgi:hypothetical protein
MLSTRKMYTGPVVLEQQSDEDLGNPFAANANHTHRMKAHLPLVDSATPLVI